MKRPRIFCQCPRLLAAYVLSLGITGCAASGAQTGFTDANWTAMGSGMNNTVYALAVMGTNVYAGGKFTMAGGKAISYLAKWDGRDWFPVGTALDGEVRALAISGTDLYVGGLFRTAGGKTVNRVARWDGSAWWPLGRGIAPDVPYNGDVRALTVSGSTLYVGGSFTEAGYATAYSFAAWDGTNWSGVGAGFNGPVLAIAASGAGLYAGGEFTRSATDMAAIARWDGYFNWTPLGSEVVVAQSAPYVAGLAFLGTSLYVVGWFGTDHIWYGAVALWDGTQWKTRLGLGGVKYIYPEAWAVTTLGTNVYIGGEFTASGLTNRVAVWDGTTWAGLASGVNATVRTLAASGNDLYVGGEFTRAGNQPAFRVARAYLPPLPQLWLERQDTNVVAAWPSPQTEGFVLEEASDFRTNWATVGGVINDDGTKRSMTMPNAYGVRYYRLRRP